MPDLRRIHFKNCKGIGLFNNLIIQHKLKNKNMNLEILRMKIKFNPLTKPKRCEEIKVKLGIKLY